MLKIENLIQISGTRAVKVAEAESSYKERPICFPTIPVRLLSHYTSPATQTRVESLRMKHGARLGSFLARHTLTVALRFKQKRQYIHIYIYIYIYIYI